VSPGRASAGSGTYSAAAAADVDFAGRLRRARDCSALIENRLPFLDRPHQFTGSLAVRLAFRNRSSKTRVKMASDRLTC
jgi:hypothetical protein